MGNIASKNAHMFRSEFCGEGSGWGGWWVNRPRFSKQKQNTEEIHCSSLSGWLEGKTNPVPQHLQIHIWLGYINQRKHSKAFTHTLTYKHTQVHIQTQEEKASGPKNGCLVSG